MYAFLDGLLVRELIGPSLSKSGASSGPNPNRDHTNKSNVPFKLKRYSIIMIRVFFIIFLYIKWDFIFKNILLKVSKMHYLCFYSWLLDIHLISSNFYLKLQQILLTSNWDGLLLPCIYQNNYCVRS